MRSILAFILLGFSMLVYAGIKVSPIYVDLDNKETSQFITVNNTGDSKEYVEVTPEMLSNPGQANEKLVPITNPHKAGLLVTPVKIVLAAGEQRLVKLSFLNQPKNADSIYRVSIAPKLNKELVPTSVDRNMGVQVLVSYDVLVIHRATNPKPLITLTRKGSTLTVKNTGNSNVLLFGGKQCVANKCASLPEKRIYANSTWVLDLPQAAPVTFSQEFSDIRSEISSN